MKRKTSRDGSADFAVLARKLITNQARSDDLLQLAGQCRGSNRSTFFCMRLCARVRSVPLHQSSGILSC